MYGLDPALRSYVIHNLDPETGYSFSVQALSAEFQSSLFSEERTISTFLAGKDSLLYTAPEVLKGGISAYTHPANTSTAYTCIYGLYLT